MSTSLHDRLADLANVVDHTAKPGDEASDLWEAGRRRHRRRRAQALAATAAAVAVLAGGGLALGLPDRGGEPTPADVPFEQLHLPRTVHAPSPWAGGTAETGPPGPLAALSIASRNEPEGWTGVRHGQGVFGVSAVDGSAVFLDLPGAQPDMLGSGMLALSPDGTKVGYDRYREGQLVGWSVYDTVTGDVTRLRDPRQPVLRGRDAFEIAFSGDSRYLQTNYSPTGSDGSRDDTFVVWDVRTGERIEAEGTGHYWLPSPGSAPSGIVWSRNRQTHLFDPLTGRTTVEESPYEVVEWSVGPDGATSVAIAFGEARRDPWRLFAGETELDPGISPDDLLGWRDAQTVVLASLPTHEVRYVDVRTGEVVGSERLRVAGDEGPLFWPQYAADLWVNELVEGVRPPRTSDPRVGPAEVAAWAVGIAVAGGLVTWLVRRRRARA